MKRKYFKKMTTLLVLFSLLLCLMPAGLSLVFGASDVIEINTVDDLISLEKSCKSDTWSLGKTVNLNADLNVKDTAFTGIPIFSGIFNGNGHTIKGVSPSDVGLATGFFRYVSKEARINNLNIEGTISTRKDGECVGGVAGVNKGIISFCTFSGTISGNQSVGGIAGENLSSGIIANCSCLGTVDAPYEVGGIAGTNHGIIRDCVNRCVVNNDKAFIDEMDEESAGWIISTITSNSNIRITTGTDVGGIAGYSDGTIIGCVNNAIIGYEHIGYNVGGIVGRQAGVVSYCTNNGTVLGRKDVGGIAGQMEPFVSVDEAASISDAVKDLHDLIEKLLDDLSDSEKGISNNLKDIKKHTDTALNLGQDISDEFIDFTNSNIDALNLLADECAYVLEKLPDILNSLDLSADAARAFGDDLKKLNDDLDILNKLDKNVYSETKHGRLTITSAVGGYITSDNISPEKDITVKLTVHPDEGYLLQSLVIIDANGKNVKFTDNKDGSYQFTMPEENVVVRSVYSYSGSFFLSTNPGGTIAKAYNSSAEKLKITVKPNAGYIFSNVYIGDKAFNIAEFNYDDGQNTYTLETSHKLPKAPVLISTEFAREESSHSITLSSSTGGIVTADKLLATQGEVVKIKVSEATDYILTSLHLIAGNNTTDLIAARTPEEALENPNEYGFSMPDTDVKIEAVFSYTDAAKNNADTVIYTESTIGGSMYFVKNPTTNDYIIYIIPEAGYEVSGPSALSIFSSATAGQETGTPVGILKTEQLTKYGNGYSYTMNPTQYTNPVRIFGSFTKVDSSNSITTTSGTGGTASTDLLSAKAGDRVKLAIAPANGYRISKITILSQGNHIDYNALEDSSNVYEFVMPDSDVDTYVEFAPIMFIATSNYGGSVSVTANGDILKFTVKPDDGYTLNSAPMVKDAQGKIITLTKRTSGVFAYEFNIKDKSSPISCLITFDGATDYEVVENSKDTINDQADTLTNAMKDAKSTADDITELVTDDYGEIIDFETFINDRDQVNELIRLIIQLVQEITEAGEAASTLLSSMNTLTNVLLPYLTDAAKAVRDDADKAIDDLDDCINYLQTAGKQTKAVVDYLNTQPSIKFTELSADFSHNISSLFDEMKEISKGLGKTNEDSSLYTDLILDDFRAINDKVNDIFELIIDIANNVENVYKNDGGFFEDVSDEELETITDGKVSLCTNLGTVKADLNVGGIIGSMSVDTEDPEDNAAGSVEWNMRNTYVTKCVLTSCNNYGEITAKGDGAGAIVGFQGIGLVTDCTACGAAESTEGEYVGGIAGRSNAIIRNCNSICSLNGSYHVGGIAGLGNKISHCYSLTVIPETGSNIGAIAGLVKFDECIHSVNPDNIHDNIFVSTTLGGIDGISYTGIAEEVSYEELIAIPGISPAFSHLAITFKVDGTTLDTIEVKYGTLLGDIAFPSIPSVDGYFGQWPDCADAVFNGNIIIEAEYIQNITTIKSDEIFTIEKEDGTQIHKNLVFIDGVFDSSAKLQVLVDKESLPDSITGGNPSVVYQIKLMDSNHTGTSKIRLYNSLGKNVKVYEKKNGQWIETDSNEYGSYQQAVMTGDEGCFALVVRKPSYLRYIIIAGCAVCAIVLIVITRLIIASAQKRKSIK